MENFDVDTIVTNILKYAVGNSITFEDISIGITHASEEFVKEEYNTPTKGVTYFECPSNEDAKSVYDKLDERGMSGLGYPQADEGAEDHVNSKYFFYVVPRSNK